MVKNGTLEESRSLDNGGKERRQGGDTSKVRSIVWSPETMAGWPWEEGGGREWKITIRTVFGGEKTGGKRSRKKIEMKRIGSRGGLLSCETLD